MLNTLRRCATAVATTACLLPLLAASPASAGVLLPDPNGCPQLDRAQVFARWLDPLHYGLAPGGDFESGSSDTAGWTLDGGASVVAGNEPFGLAPGTHSLRLPAGASATSPTVCVSVLDAMLRYVVRSPGTLLGTLRAQILLQGPDGTPVLSAPIGLEAGLIGGWRPSLPNPIVANLLAVLPGDQAPVRVRFTAGGGTWLIDDVFVDPYGRG